MEQRSRLINLMVSKITETAFSPDVAIALREYADAIEEANASWDKNKTAGRHNPDVFETSNGCKILVIAGWHEAQPNVKPKASI